MGLFKSKHSAVVAACVRLLENYGWWYKSCITSRALDYGNYGIVHYIINRRVLDFTSFGHSTELTVCPHNIGAQIITNTVVGVPYYNHSIMGPKALFSLLRPLHETHWLGSLRGYEHPALPAEGSFTYCHILAAGGALRSCLWKAQQNTVH